MACLSDSMPSSIACPYSCVYSSRKSGGNGAASLSCFLRTDINVFLMIGLRFLKEIGIEGLARHLEQNGSDSINSGEILRVQCQHAPKFLDCVMPAPSVFFARCAGDVLRGVCRREIQPRVQQFWVKLFCAAEVRNRLVNLPVFECRDAVVEQVPRLNLRPGLRRSLLR